ncbi:hypothetical protein E3P89_03592 [Wallemia ichthyophaga]|uniref:PPIase cyclophilin-type domain-containing protein n=1 Tax=Wallemia ichthyophaga TaxID=245174 RepID=A0A4T0HWD5_WALIC|nr:hypothetical protein E3P93_03718 [Wallemia ichthyophaga]TIB08584.1 hypothetical protein E3P90_03639 [Wallemia ichthyophaga]TIB19863.1 hypothetical protein E3P89_03592 [Wallemia ichthyophaga]TIB21112.1 hypothetical protein E3P88_03634 [Wallemia ichthyophaga]TIB29244.1 hypothetical protein E3P84_03782 [Wallemia ichthyophaga]
MSSIYNLEPYTNGKVLLQTTVGDIELELWGKECPKAVRNFIALSLEGYYDNCIFHRVVPEFIVQSGDPTGTGTRGESFFGEPFETEPHQRLRFNRRGLVGMAHSVDPDTAERDNRGRILRTNTSQFFITMASTPELTGTNTLFGRIVGDTIFNALKIGSYETDSNEKPLYPPKIKSIKILINPFGDIVPRITRAERISQSRAKEERQKERTEEMAKLGRKKAKKNTKLLSFGEEEETDEQPVQPSKIKSSHDLLDDNTLLKEDDTGRSGKGYIEKSETEEKQSSNRDKSIENKPKKTPDLSSIRKQYTENTDTDLKESIRHTEDAIQSIKGGNKGDEGKATKKEPNDDYTAMLSSYKNKNKNATKANKKINTLDRLKAFKEGLKGVSVQDEPGDKKVEDNANTPIDAPYDYDKDDDDDPNWMNHQLHSSQTDRLQDDQARRAEVDYDVIDPRQFKRARKHENPNSDIRGRSGGAYSRR